MKLENHDTILASSRIAYFFLLVVISLATLAHFATAQDDDDEERRAGLIATFAGADGKQFRRIDRTIAFDWQDSRPDARLSDGPFTATWNGYLKSQASGPYRLLAYVNGRVQIKLKNQVVLTGETEERTWIESDPQELEFDWHPIQIQFEKADKDASIALFWAGPKFTLEPIGSRQFYHDPNNSSDGLFERGELLASALRCASCHDDAKSSSSLAAPDLSKLKGNIHQQWVVEWLTTSSHRTDDTAKTIRRMPDFEISKEEANAIAAFLYSDSPLQKKRKPPKGDRKKGERLFLTLGCLACHSTGPFGENGLYGGGDLTSIASKRPSDFFAAWLKEPATINRHHRMPVFPLAEKERGDLAVYLAALGKKPEQVKEKTDNSRVDTGKKLFIEHRCSACHDSGKAVVDESKIARVPGLNKQSDWSRACSNDPNQVKNRPGFKLNTRDQRALRLYFENAQTVSSRPSELAHGELLLQRNNCTSCHARTESQGIAAKLPDLAKAHSSLAPLIPAMTPPSLVSIGDKLHSASLADAIRQKGGPRRSWLHIRMPRFRLSDDDLVALVDYFVTKDRIPDRKQPEIDNPKDAEMMVTGARLVTTSGFGCTSCHQVGDSIPPKAPLNARGPDLSMLGQRVRRQWYDRFVRNPIRIVPRMEMPTIQIPVQGVLHENLDHQLAAVWHVFNQPEFQPPKPGAVRIVRHTGDRGNGRRASILTDVLKTKDTMFVKPFVIGLPNRHNVLFDVNGDALAGWWIGDTAYQQTQGKTWYWEPGAPRINADRFRLFLHAIKRDGVTLHSRRDVEKVTEVDSWQHTENGVAFQQRLNFHSTDASASINKAVVRVRHEIGTVWANNSADPHGFRHRMIVRDLNRGDAAVVATSINGAKKDTPSIVSKDGRTLLFDKETNTRSTCVAPKQGAFNQAKINGDEHLLVKQLAKDGDHVVFEFEYLTDLPQDRLPPKLLVDSPIDFEPITLDVVPGYEATRLPIPNEIMPTGFAWRPDGTLIVSSLKGRVWLAWDSDSDGLEDEMSPFSDDLAAPYGVAATGKHIDVINKYALVRLFDDNDDGLADRTVKLASGWGHTADYHDWVVGLPQDAAGCYYVGVPCQQDKRSLEAALYRGKVLKLVPRNPATSDLSMFAIETLSGGHRFPMGVARNRDGALFVTDNQGNYNPFNELNHVVKGARFGFINAVERKDGFKPPLTAPAIDIPHPWTRSVNGICFLETPDEVRDELDRDLFGPFEGHLIGCEYDTRRLIRMSLQKVGKTYQGAAYPFSYDQPPTGEPLLGPLVCDVARDGDIYVGSIRDSGWGGSNNIGSIVRMRPSKDGAPPGIAEVRATRDGFTILFTSPVVAKVASKIENYTISSYTRVPTPAYGGADQDRRTEKIVELTVSDDASQVTLKLDALREGFVYEFRLKNLTNSKQFFPAEAHYTLRVTPR